MNLTLTETETKLACVDGRCNVPHFHTSAIWAIKADAMAKVLEREAESLIQETCAGHYNPNACETCRVVESLRDTAAHIRADYLKNHFNES